MRRLRAIALSLLATVGLAASATPASAAPPNSWTATGPLATTRLGGVGAALPGDRALVTGGQNSGGTTLMSTEIYSATTNSWSSAPDMGTGRVVATATELPNGKVLVAGGMTTTSASSALDTGEVYDPVANTWTPVANTMSTKRGRHVAVLLPNGTVVIAGGNDTTGNATTSADLYDPATNKFSPAASMGTARIFPGIAVLSTGRALIAGGTTNLSNPAVATAETYDPAGNSWTPTANAMSGGARFDPSAAALPGGKALVAGGAPQATTGTAATASADVYDSATNSFSAAGNTMSSPRLAGSATALSDGRVLVVGGLPSTSSTASATSTADLFIPASGTFAAAASMGVGRNFMATARLDDGRVLEAGGGSVLNPANALATAEAYQPTTGAGAPTGASASPAIGAATLTWAAPPFDGGSQALRYRITTFPGGATLDTTDARLTTRVTRLQNGRAYTFTTTAINEIAPGLPSAATNAVTPTTRILNNLAAVPGAFTAARSGPSATSSRRRRAPKPGTIVQFRLIEPAAVIFTVERAARGVRRGRRCLGGRRGRRCTRYLRVRGSFRRTGGTGRSRFRFTGRIGGRTLASGRYRLVATPREVTGRTGDPVRVSFRVRR